MQALVLTPTRELCIQVTQALRAYGQKKGVSVVAVFGGAPIRDQMSRVKENAQVVVGTVGRVMDLMSRHALVVTSARYVVLDEADEMLDLGFFEDVETILSRCPSGRQTALFSATMPPEIKRLAEQGMYDPVTIKVKAATLTIDTVEQFFVEVSDRDKQEKLVEVVKAERPDQAIIFVRTKIGADRLSRRLNDAGVRVKALHGDMSQGQRDGVMIAFKGGARAAARGHRRRRARAGHLGRDARDQLRRAELTRHLRAPHRPHRPRRAARAARSRSSRRSSAATSRRSSATRRPRSAPWSADAPAAAAAEARASRARGPAPAPHQAAEEPGRRARQAHRRPGLKQGLEPADVIGAIVDHSHLEGEDISNVRLLDRFSFVEVPAARAEEVASTVSGKTVRGVPLKLEVAKR